MPCNSLANSLPMGSSGNRSFNTDNVGFIPIDMHFRVTGDSKLPLSVSVCTWGVCWDLIQHVSNEE